MIYSFIIYKHILLLITLENMERAIYMSMISSGGPFGAVITNKDGDIIAEAHNEVTVNNDPTAHAEIQAIRKACKRLKDFKLTDCVLYTSCEPCPMCLGAIYWSRISKIYYANTRTDAANIDFDDSEIYEEVAKDIKDRKIKMIQIGRDEAIVAFDNWKKNNDKIKY